MKKIITKMMQFIMIISMIFSSIQTPLLVLADTIDSYDGVAPKKGDIKLGENGEISSNGSVSVTATNGITGEGAVSVTKTVKKVNDTGKYNVTFSITGEEYTTSSTAILPSYTVFVLDASSSMKTNASGGGTLWSKAKSAAINFSQKLIEAGQYEEDGVTKNTNNIALVTFAGSVVESFESFSQESFKNAQLGDTKTGTNYQAGFDAAYELLNDLSNDVKNSSSLNVIFISDGEPNRGNCTSQTSCNTSLAKLKALGEGVNIYTFAYELKNNSTAQNLLKSISTNNKVESVTAEDVDSVLAGFVETVSGSRATGTINSFKDGIGDSFKVVKTDSSYEFGESYVDNTQASITEDEVTISFDIQINPEASTGWHNTNDGFELVYVDSKTNETMTVSCDENPYVYWESYKYTVNYYKDSVTDGPLLGSYTETVEKDTVIDETDLEIDKHLSDAGEGYEFKLLSPSSITVNNPLETPIINVLYTLKEYTYKVQYYYDEVLYSEINNIKPVTYGTEVEPSKYYLTNEDILEGYKLDSDNTDSETVVIDRENKVIRIYYIKDNFDYTVNYHFGDEEVIDNTNTNNTGNALFGSIIDPEDKYLTQDKLINKGYGEYFINPNKPHLPEEGLIIGADSSKNIIDIYYIKTEVDNEITKKTANKSVIGSSSELIQYTVNYKTNISNVKEGETITVTIVDTLPKKIDESKSSLNGGVYNETDNTITWIFNLEVSEFTKNYVIDKTVVYTVNYQDFANMSSSLNNSLLNTVKGMVTINSNTSDGSQDEEEVIVAIDGTLIVNHVDETGKDLIPSVTTINKVGTGYSESKKDIYGYTIKTEPDNKNGEYIEGTITVTFIYTKNDGTVTDNKVSKIGPENVTSISDKFNYTLKYQANIVDYVGNVTLTLTDKLPYEIDEDKSTYDNRCTYNNKTLVCTKEININENNQEIKEEFELSLVFKNIDSNKVVNEVDAKLVYGNNEVENEDKIETEVLKGTVIATYKDTLGNVLTEVAPITELAGMEYTTEELEFLGYTLTAEPTNKTGKYVANTTIYVEYIYSKNVGTSEEELVKTGNELVTDINKPFEYTITYNTEIFDYVGNVEIEIIDIPAHVIDEEKSIIGNNCQFVDGKIVCKYNLNIANKNDSIINITENLVLYYKNITDSLVNNKVSSTLKYGEIVKENDAQWDTLVAKGNVLANYVTDNGQKLADSIMTSDLVGKEYQTNELVFDGYFLKEVQGEETGVYTEETINVTYVYSTIPLPPQTGVNNYLGAYLNMLLGVVFLFVIRKRI